MSYARTLQRALDLDLIARIDANGGTVQKLPKPKSKNRPRPWFSYRGAQRNMRLGRT
jgi:hypothetical protein